MDPIKNIVSDLMGQMSCGKGISTKEIQGAWQRISKDKVTRVADFKDGALVVMADSSMRLVRLNLNRENFLKELQKEFPSIKKIIFKVGV